MHVQKNPDTGYMTITLVTLDAYELFDQGVRMRSGVKSMVRGTIRPKAVAMNILKRMITTSFLEITWHWSGVGSGSVMFQGSEIRPIHMISGYVDRRFRQIPCPVPHVPRESSSLVIVMPGEMISTPLAIARDMEATAKDNPMPYRDLEWDYDSLIPYCEEIIAAGGDPEAPIVMINPEDN